jgi:hypothetical protein
MSELRVAWLSDLIGALGLPVGGATAAVALYYGSIAAEKEARPEVLKDIAEILKNKSWSIGNQPNVLVERMFCLTFGERQLSIKCMVRSFVSSTIFVATIFLLSFAFEQSEYRIYKLSFDGSIVSVLDRLIYISLIPDYSSIAKARVIIRHIGRSNNFARIIALVLVDIILSVLIAVLSMMVYQTFEYVVLPGYGFNGDIKESFLASFEIAYESISDILGIILGTPHGDTWLELFTTSTLLTSMWAIIAIASLAVAKMLVLADYARKFTTWFFNVDEHPIRAVGVVAGGMILMASLTGTLIGTLLRAL